MLKVNVDVNRLIKERGNKEGVMKDEVDEI
jgi:hypothetical protein